MFRRVLVSFLLLNLYSYVLFCEVVPLTEVSPERESFSLEVANLVNEYFSKPYEEAGNKTSIFYALNCPDGSVVYRPNHSLAHGMRQAYLAADLVLALKQANGDLFTHKEEGKRFTDWVKDKLATDTNFLKKVELANAFQRTGRKSEISRGQDQQKYEAYLLADQENFIAKAKDYVGPNKLFKDQQELDVYKQAIVRKFSQKESGISDELYFLSKIFFAAHLFDLRRLPHFNKDQLHKEISSYLFGTEEPNKLEQKLIKTIWAKAGDYLAATGDRDMEDSKRSNFDGAVFCAQAHDPQLLVHALQLARTKPEEKLIKSIVSHAQVMRELKELFKERFKNIKQAKKARELRVFLEKSPYTASEGYLKILLGDKFVEIPKSASEEEAKDITNQNVRAFLAEPKRVSSDNISMVPRVENPDDHYVNVLVDAMMEERKNRGKFVFYHTTEPEAGSFFDVISELRSQLQITGGEDIRALRAIDKEFIQFNEEVQKGRSQDATKEKATVIDFMNKFRDVADSSDAYRTMGLSTNFSLFGSDQQKWADTYNMFYLVKDQRVATQPLQYEKFFSYIEQYTGIPLEYSRFKKLLDRFILTCSGQPCRNGRLIQIFIDPSVVNDMAYLSVLLGTPVLKDGVSPAFEEPIKILRKSPDELLDYLKKTSVPAGSEGAQRLGSVELQLHDLQARVFMRPDFMFDPKLVSYKSYWRFDETDWIKEYRGQIKSMINDGLVAWLKTGAGADPDAFDKDTEKLRRLVQEVYRGTTGTEAPQASVKPLPDQLIKLLESGRYEQAARLFEDNYALLKDEIFTIPKDQKGRGGGNAPLKELYLHVNFEPLYEIAFRKGLFAGGENAYQVISMLPRIEHYEFINSLSGLVDPAKSCELFLQYFKGKADLTWDIVDLIKTINEIDNDETIIEQAQPLLKYFNYNFSKRVLLGLAGIPKEHREAIIEETLNQISEADISGYQETQRKIHIQGILAQVYDMRNVDEYRKNLIWLVTKRLDDSWERRLYLIEGVKATESKILEVINNNLKSPPNDDYIDNMKKSFRQLAFNTSFSTLINLFKDQLNVDLRNQIETIIKHYKPEYHITNLAKDMSFLLDTNDKNLLENGLDNFKNIAGQIWVMVNQDSKEHRQLILSATKKILLEQPDWGFLPILNRMQEFKKDMLRAFNSDEFTVNQIMNTPLTPITWQKDPYTERQFYSRLSAPFTYEEVLEYAESNPGIYNMMFLKSLEGRALINTFIDRLNKEMVPTNVCTYLTSAYNRSNPTAGYNISLLAECVSKLAPKE